MKNLLNDLVFYLVSKFRMKPRGGVGAFYIECNAPIGRLQLTSSSKVHNKSKY